MAVLTTGCGLVDIDAGGSSDGAPRPDDMTIVVGEVAEVGDADLVVNAAAVGAPFSRRLLGTNIPAWIGHFKHEEPWFAPSLELVGAELIRLPGGSWSNHYDWLACLDGDQERCFWHWATDVSDFLDIISLTDAEIMWTASFNGTPEEAAGLVAFFNGDVDDDTVIGVDANDRDWLTVGHWASRRSDLGYPDPVRVQLWEIGNEIFGAEADRGENCAEWGWENVSTCDGAEYATGTTGQPGFLDYHAAMIAVDPTIEIGAVGVSPVDSWSNFGGEVLDLVGDELDFYVVHDYGFGGTPEEDRALDIPSETWHETMTDYTAALDAEGLADIPVAVTEYNMVAWHDADTDALMSRALNLFYLTDSIGEMAVSGVEMAAQWDMYGVPVSSGANYGMVHQDTAQVLPAFYSLRLWSLMGDTLVPVAVSDDLTAFASTSADGGVQILVMNTTSSAQTVTLRVDGIDGDHRLLEDRADADSLRSKVVRYNGAEAPTVLDIDPAPIDLGIVGDTFDHTFPAVSVTVLRLEPAAG